MFFENNNKKVTSTYTRTRHSKETDKSEKEDEKNGMELIGTLTNIVR